MDYRKAGERSGDRAAGVPDRRPVAGSHRASRPTADPAAGPYAISKTWIPGP